MDGYTMIGQVGKRGRGVYLANSNPDADHGDDYWEAFSNLRAAKRWVAEGTEMPVRWEDIGDGVWFCHAKDVVE